MNAEDILKKLIACPSVTPEDAGAQDVIIKALKPLGFTVHDVTSGGVRNSFLRKGDSAPHFCFAGHTDVVPAGDETKWTSKPFDPTVRDGALYGRGAADMKGNIAAFISAVARYDSEKSLPHGSISLLITGDEEGDAVHGTKAVLEWMEMHGHIPDVCLVGEPSNPEHIGDEIKIGRRGSLSGELTVCGKQGHVAYPHLADNPIPRLLKMLDKLSDTVLDRGSAYFPETNVEITSIDVGNSAGNVIPASVKARFNIRFNDRWTATTLSRKVDAIFSSVSEDYEVNFHSNAESFLTRAGEWTGLVRDAVADVTGRQPAMTTSGGTSDARFVHKYCPVVEFGLINKTIHQVDEHVDLQDLEMLTEIYHTILTNYFRSIY